MATDDFFHARLDTTIDLRNPLAKLAQRMPWDAIEVSLAPLLAHQDRAGRKLEGPTCLAQPFRSPVLASATQSDPRLPIRLMVSLRYLKHAFNESDESLVER